jgi:uncharacterized protein with FMN-binding domain
MRTWLIVGAALVILVLAVIIGGTRGMEEIRNYKIPAVSLERISDGVYEGAYSKTRWGLSVKVTVKDHIIENIEITDKKSSNITKDLITRLNMNLIDTKEPEFEAVSGATMTSKGYVIAVADALQ